MEINYHIRIRFFNNLPGENLDIIAGNIKFSNLNYKDITPYFNLYNSNWINIFKGNKILHILKVDLTNNQDYTFIINEEKVVWYMMSLKKGTDIETYMIRVMSSNDGVNIQINNKIIHDEDGNYHKFSLTSIMTINNHRHTKTYHPRSKAIYSLILTKDDDFVLVEDNFDVDSYMGHWHQIAAIPQNYGLDCSYSTAEYTKMRNYINVFNTCYDNNGQIIRTITGQAINLDKNIPSSLAVRFFDQQPFETNYLILETDYKKYALIGSPNKKSLYIISRESRICQNLYQELVNLADSLGYNKNLLKID